ncbi:MAG: cyclodeaminase/cyclohydrolase family protein, partial [Spirochaetaceae bacterium]|nr:cyclodeaminase/cyclohydrolase family protein [Spirochaetaceae bacterium]
ETAKNSAEMGNVNSLTDAAVGAQIAYTGVRGGIINVLINLKNIKDRDFIREMKSKCEELNSRATDLLYEVNQFVDNKLSN